MPTGFIRGFLIKINMKIYSKKNDLLYDCFCEKQDIIY